jgi:hypothetical protein
VTSHRPLEAHSGSRRRLDGIAFQKQSADSVLAWGPSDVLLWERVAAATSKRHLQGQGLGTGTGGREEDEDVEGEWTDSLSEAKGASVLEGEVEDKDRSPAGEGADARVGSYRLVYALQVGDPQFMHGCCLARQLPGAQTLRLVLREGWVLDQQ